MCNRTGVTYDIRLRNYVALVRIVLVRSTLDVTRGLLTVAYILYEITFT